MATYRGVEITGKTDAEVAQQMKNVEQSGTITSGTLNNTAGAAVVPTPTNVAYPPVPTPTPTVTDPWAAFNTYVESLSAPTNQADIYNTEYKNAGLEQKTQQVNDLTSQLNTINTNAQVANQTLESQAGGKDVTGTFLGRQQQEVNRQAAIQGLPVAAQLASAQGNLASAQQHLDTLFQIKSQDAQNLNDYNNKLKEMAFNFATTQQKAILDAQIRKEDRANVVADANRKNQQEWAKAALDGGDPQMMAKIIGLNESSPTFAKDLASLTSTMKPGIDFQLKQAQLAKVQRETQLLGKPTAEEKKATAAALKNAQASIPAMNDKITLAETLKSGPGMSVRVGPNPASRQAGSIWANLLPGVALSQLTVGAVNTTGAGNAFAGGVHNLVNGLTLQNLIDAKAQGATFGALSDAELSLLASSATKISDWEMKTDKGVGKGIWNVSQEEFKKELDNIQRLTQRAIYLQQQNLISSDEQSVLDSAYTNQPAANYYK